MLFHTLSGPDSHQENLKVMLLSMLQYYRFFVRYLLCIYQCLYSILYMYIRHVRCGYVPNDKLQYCSTHGTVVPLFYNPLHYRSCLGSHSMSHRNVVSQDRWALVTGLITLKCRALCQEYLVSQDRFYCILRPH